MYGQCVIIVVFVYQRHSARKAVTEYAEEMIYLWIFFFPKLLQVAVAVQLIHVFVFMWNGRVNPLLCTLSVNPKRIILFCTCTVDAGNRVVTKNYLWRGKGKLPWTKYDLSVFLSVRSRIWLEKTSWYDFFKATCFPQHKIVVVRWKLDIFPLKRGFFIKSICFLNFDYRINAIIALKVF